MTDADDEFEYIDLKKLRADEEAESERFWKDMFPPTTGKQVACSDGRVFDTMEDALKDHEARHKAALKAKDHDPELLFKAPTLSTKIDQLRRAFRILDGLEVGQPCVADRFKLLQYWWAFQALLPRDERNNIYYRDPVKNSKASQLRSDSELVARYVLEQAKRRQTNGS